MNALIASRSRSRSVVAPSWSRIVSSTPGVVGWIDDHGDGFVVLRRAADHRGAADIDLLDRFRQRDLRLRDRRFEWIKIHDYEVDWLKPLFPRLLFVQRISTLVEQASMDARMQRFHAAFEHFGIIGEARDVAHRHAFFPQQLCCSAGGDDVDALRLQRPREVGDAGFVET
jgi:hypothetical protein